MQSVKTFLVTFLSSVCIVLLSFAALYWAVTPSDTQVDTNQTGIPIVSAESGDVKTVLITTDAESARFFFLLKLNGIEPKISLAAIPSGYQLAAPGRTLTESFEYAGIMQCVQDLGEELNVKIDYHLLLDKDGLKQLTSSFGDVSFNSHLVPDELYSFFSGASIDTNTLVDTVCSYASYLDNEQGLTLLTGIAMHLIENNMPNIQSYTLSDITDSFSYLSTNIGTQEAARLDRILTLLSRTSPQTATAVLSNSATAKEDIARLFEI